MLPFPTFARSLSLLAHPSHPSPSPRLRAAISDSLAFPTPRQRLCCTAASWRRSRVPLVRLCGSHRWLAQLGATGAWRSCWRACLSPSRLRWVGWVSWRHLLGWGLDLSSGALLGGERVVIAVWGAPVGPSRCGRSPAVDFGGCPRMAALGPLRWGRTLWHLPRAMPLSTWPTQAGR